MYKNIKHKVDIGRKSKGSSWWSNQVRFTNRMQVYFGSLYTFRVPRKFLCWGFKKKKNIQYAGSWQIVNKKVIRCFWLLGVRADVYVMLSAEVFCRFVWCMFSDRQVGGGQYVRGYDKDYQGQGPCPSSHRLIAFCPSMDRPSPLLYQYRTDVMDQKTL